MSDLWINVVIGVLKAFGFVYDVVAFLPYYIICRPDLKVRQSKRLKARRINEDPESPFRSVDSFQDLTTSLFPECCTLDDLFLRAVRLYGPKNALGTRELLKTEDEVQPNGRVFKKVILGEYQWMTFEEAFTRASNFGSGLLSLGQKPRKNILIFSETSAEWMLAAQSCFKYNFPVVTLYATLSSDAIVHGVNESEVTHVLTSAELLPNFKSLLDQMPKVTHLICMSQGTAVSQDDVPSRVRLLSMAHVEEIGAKPENIQTPVPKPAKEDIAVIMYTSGSTGIPKGVIISHGNLMSGMSGQCQKICGLGPDDVYVGYLPLAHVLELSAEMSCLSHGTCIGYSSPLTLTDQSSKIKKGSKGDVSVLKPTLMASVPVIMDRLYKGVWEKVNGDGPARRALFVFAYDYKNRRLKSGYDTPMFNRILFQRIRDLLGGRIRLMLSGGAPLSEATQRFMNVCFCCPVLQGYGLTETCGAGTITEVGDLSTGRVGAPLTCSEIRLRDWPEGGYTNKDKPCPRGEILVGGGNIAMGYYKNEEKTKEDFTTIAGVRYFCTGDIGQFDDDGCLRIIDRRKDLVKLQTGEYISLSKLETVLKMSPLVDQICAYASSHHMYSIVLVVPNQKNLESLAESIGLKGLSFEELCDNPKVEKEFLKKLAEAGTKSKVDRLDKFEIPQRVKLCTEMWMPTTGLVTDAFKLKRRNIEDKYKADISRMYDQ